MKAFRFAVCMAAAGPARPEQVDGAWRRDAHFQALDPALASGRVDIFHALCMKLQRNKERGTQGLGIGGVSCRRWDSRLRRARVPTRGSLPERF